MKKLFAAALALIITASAATAQNCWTIARSGAIELDPAAIALPYSDHIEMSGEQVSCVARWSVGADSLYRLERSLVFPALRVIPNNTHGSLMRRVATDILPMVSIDNRTLVQISTSKVSIDGALTSVTLHSVAPGAMPEVEVTQTLFPSTKLPMVCEVYTVKNIAPWDVELNVPEYCQSFCSEASRGVDGAYVVQSDLQGAGSYKLQPGDSASFTMSHQAYRKSGGSPVKPDVKAEYAARMAFIRGDIDSALILHTPDSAINSEFRFAKIRASESIYRTKGGLMHGPGGESYYAATWCNDECEYVNPFYPYLGYSTGNESALNCYLQYAAFQNDEYNPIPSSIIAEGTATWSGVGDRGDAAMVTHGAGRYLLARGSREEAEQLWPFVKWCLEYCRRQLNEQGVPRSDTDELEYRFPAGKANLSTACLYYDGLISAAYLAPLMGESAATAKSYRKQAEALREAIGSYFGANVGGYETYQYYDGNNLLRSWICLPLCFGIDDRAEGTLAALFSDRMMTVDGILTQEGSETFWDRSTLYALRGAFAAGYADEALVQLHNYSQRRLLGTHVPYPVEAWPEGSQRHLSGESGLYCRVITEGLFGIRPTGFDSFDLKINMPSQWSGMSLESIRAFGRNFSIAAERTDKGKLKIDVTCGGKTRTRNIRPGDTVSVKLR